MSGSEITQLLRTFWVLLKSFLASSGTRWNISVIKSEAHLTDCISTYVVLKTKLLLFSIFPFLTVICYVVFWFLIFNVLYKHSCFTCSMICMVYEAITTQPTTHPKLKLHWQLYMLCVLSHLLSLPWSLKAHRGQLRRHNGLIGVLPPEYSPCRWTTKCPDSFVTSRKTARERGN